MKNQVLRLALLGTVAIVLASAPTNAQSPRGISVEIPFGFVVNGTAIEPGSYVIAANPRGPQDILEIHSRDRRLITNIRVQSLAGRSAADEEPRLVFNRYAGGHFLAEIWWNASEGGRLPVGKAERRLREDGSAPSPVSVKTRAAVKP